MIKNQTSRTAAIVTAAQLLLLCTLGLCPSANSGAKPGPRRDPLPGRTLPRHRPYGGGELEQVIVTGYLIPRIGKVPNQLRP